MVGGLVQASDWQKRHTGPDNLPKCADCSEAVHSVAGEIGGFPLGTAKRLYVPTVQNRQDAQRPHEKASALQSLRACCYLAICPFVGQGVDAACSQLRIQQERDRYSSIL